MRPLLASIVAAVLLSGASAAVPTEVRAQEAESDAERTARARSLFEEGVAHADAAEWREAARKFREAVALRDAPAVRYNLASALVALGEYAEAESIARALGDDPATPPDLRDRARELLGQIAENAGRLEVQLRGATRGVTVRIDGEAADASQVLHEFSLEPRGYTVVIERDGREIERREVAVERGRTADVSITVAPSPEETAAAAQEAEPTDEGSSDADVTKSWVFWTAVGGAVVMAILLAVVAAN